MTKRPTRTRDDKAAAAAERVENARAAALAPIVAAIETGLADPRGWSMPWHNARPDHLAPYCPTTDRYYTGGNHIALALASIMTGAAPHWGTFQQWRELSKHSTDCNRTATAAGTRAEKRPDCGPACHIVSVRRGETAAASIIRPAMGKRRDADGNVILRPDGTEDQRVIGWTAYPVFHAGQIDGYEMPATEPRERPADAADIDAAYMWAASIGARVTESPTAGASYSRTLDRVTMPDRDRFTTGHGAWSTMTHELTHWTGHETRLDRVFGERFGDDAYAAEELVAELGAAFTLAALGRSAEPREDHAQYLASWLRVLKADSAHLWTVASKAEAAAAYLIQRAAVLPETVAA